MPRILDISLKYRNFMIFRRNIDDFTDFLANGLSVGKIVLVSTNIRYFDNISTDKSDILFLGWGSMYISRLICL